MLVLDMFLLFLSLLWVIYVCSLACLVISDWKPDTVNFTFLGALYILEFSGKLLTTLWSFQDILLKFIIWNQNSIHLGLILPIIEAIPHYWGNTQCPTKYNVFWIIKRLTLPGPMQALWIVLFICFRWLFFWPQVVSTQHFNETLWKSPE